MLNVTATGGSVGGYLTAYAGRAARPAVSNINYGGGQTVPNLVTVALGTNVAGGNNHFVTLYNGSAGTVHLLADVSGYVTPGAAGQGAFAQVTPTRLLDTRSSAPVQARQTVSFGVANVGGVPADASAVVLNVAAAGSQAAGYVTAYPAGSALPRSSNINFAAGRTTTALALVPVGHHGMVTLYNGSTGSTHLIADIQGYLAAGDPTTPGALGALASSRVLDTRNMTPVPGAQSVTRNVLGPGGVPRTGVSAVVLSVAVTKPGAGGYLPVFGGMAATTRPTASNLNYAKGQTVANLVVVKPDANGNVTFYNVPARRRRCSPTSPVTP